MFILANTNCRILNKVAKSLVYDFCLVEALELDVLGVELCGDACNPPFKVIKSLLVTFMFVLEVFLLTLKFLLCCSVFL